MNLVTKEGLGLDDTYWIEEFEETVSGEVVKVKRGFVKIRNVGDNKKDETATSYAQTITGSNYSMGLSVTEIPLLGINGLIGFGVFPVSIAKFDNRPPSDQFLKSGDDYNFALTVTAEHKTAFGAVAAVQTSLANTARISEFWAHAGGGIAIIAPEGKFYISKFTSSGSSAGIDSIEIAPALTGYVQVGAVKKFYFRRFGIVAQADLKYALTSFTASGKDKKNDKDVTYKLLNGTIGADVRAALEIYMTPTISVGAGAEYNLFAANTSWSATVTDSDNNDLTKNDNAKGPEINYGGLAFSLWVNYSLPSLK
jgi:hypothetical protein